MANNRTKKTAKPAANGRENQRKMVVRQARLDDVSEIAALSRRVYAPDPGYSQRAIRSQIINFPEGQFIAEYEGEVVGHCATFIISGDAALNPHSWAEITGDGLASRHDPEGDYLYGMEVSVDPNYRRLRIGRRLYAMREKLCQELRLKGIVFGGRMPGYARRQRTYPNPDDYVQAVADRKIRDTAIRFHLSNDFEPIGVLKDYDPDDKDSLGYATHMVWLNPLLRGSREKPGSERAHGPARPGARRDLSSSRCAASRTPASSSGRSNISSMSPRTIAPISSSSPN